MNITYYRYFWPIFFGVTAFIIAQLFGYTLSHDDMTYGLAMAGIGRISDLTDLRGRRSALAKDIRDMLEDSKKSDKRWDPKDQEKYDAKIAEIDNIDTDIKNIQTYLDKISDEAVDDQVIEKLNAKTGKKDSKVRDLHNKWIRQGDHAMTAQEWAIIQNTMSVGTPSQGGYSVQIEVAQYIADALKWYGGVRDEVTIIQTQAGNTFNYPTSDGTSETGELIGENTTATALDPILGAVSLAVYKFSSKVITVPFELLQDSNVDIEAFVNKRLIDRLGRVQNTYFTNGTGTGQPMGLVTAALSGKIGLTGQTVSLIFDDLVDLEHSVDIGYRKNNNCCFMMHDTSFKVIKKIKDAQGRPIFLPGYDGISAPVKASILGYDICVNNDVPVMAANAKSILFGDYSYYIVRDVMDFQLFRFTDSAYAKLGQVGFMMWGRSGGNLVDIGGAVKFYQNSAT